jgi:predicted site-specific integrase-resolvase
MSENVTESAIYEGLTDTQERLLLALLDTPDTLTACEKASVSRQTYYRFMREEKFVAAYFKARRRIRDSAIARLEGISLQAVNVIYKVMTAPGTGDSARMNAAKAILDKLYSGVSADIEERLQAIERRRT